MINISYSDIERWLKEARWDILREVHLVTFRVPKQRGFYFGKTIPQGHPPCPFLAENPHPGCIIYSSRPRACRDYPSGSCSWKKCPAYVEPTRKDRDKVISAQYQDFKRAYVKREKICDLLKIVRAYPDKVLAKRLKELS